MCVCVRARAHVCVCARVCVCLCLCEVQMPAAVAPRVGPRSGAVTGGKTFEELMNIKVALEPSANEALSY